MYAQEPVAGPYAPAVAPAPSSFEVADRVLRLLLRRALRGLVGLWELLRPRLGWVVITAFLLGVIGFLSLLLALPRLARSGPASDTRVAMIVPAASVVDFLRGQQTFDADLMWESFSPELRSALEQREITKDALAQQMERERQAGQRYQKFEYVGGVPVEGQQTMYFYTVAIDSPVPERNGIFSYIFTVDRDGKIVSVKM
jgi:hypothetical protein